MVLRKFWAALLFLPSLTAQTNLLTVDPPAAVPAKRGSTVQAKIKAVLQPGYHANSNTPSDDYLIPLKLTWDKGLLESPVVAYPKAQMDVMDVQADLSYRLSE